MKVSSSPKLNCSHFIVSMDGNNSTSIEIKEVTVGNQKDYKLLAQYNVFLNRRDSVIPFIKDIIPESSLGYGIHCSLNDNNEFLKIWIPKKSGNLIQLMDGIHTECIISLDSQDAMNDCIIAFTRPALNDGSDGSAVTLHSNESTPHDDIFYATFTGSNSYGLCKNYRSKLARNADVVNNTYIDRNGQLQYLGDY